MKQKLQMMASEVTLSAQNRRHMTLSMRILSTRKNRNGHAVTERFIDKIVAGGQDYVCMPLCADVSRLIAKDYGRLTHMYDERAGMFRAPQIGSFIELEKRYDEYGACLYGTARINKRDPRVTEAIMELYAAKALNVSFEIEAGTLEMRDGTLIVDDAEDNDLTGVCVVSVPAYPESEALSQVAEATKDRSRAMIGSAYVMLPEDLDLQAVYHEVLRAICNTLQITEFDVMLLEVHAGYAIFRFGEMQDRTYRADYILTDDHRALVTEVYAVAWERIRQEGETMYIEETMVEAAAQTESAVETVEEVVSAETAVAEEQAEETAVVAAETEEVAAETEADETAEVSETEVIEAQAEEGGAEQTQTIESSVGEIVVEEVEETAQEDALRAELEQLKAQYEELTNSFNQLQAELAEANNRENERKENERRENMRVFAQAQGMDIEEAAIASMIDALDYEALVAEANRRGTNKVASLTVRMEAEMSSKPYGGLLERE